MARSFDQPRATERGFSREAGADTRRRLIAAAAILMTEHGWDAVTTRQIAERAGVNQGLIHYHFGSKDELLQQAFAEALREAFAEPGMALARAPRFAEAVANLIRAMEPGEEIEPIALFSVEAMSRAARDVRIGRSMAEVLAEFRDHVAGRIVAAQRRAELPRTMDPIGTATALGALLDGLGMHVLIDPSIDVRRTASAVAKLLSGGRSAG